MHRTKSCLLAAMAVLALSLPANAGFQTGKSIAATCQFQASGQVSGACMSYVVGAIDGLLLTDSGKSFCLPEQATQGQVAAVFSSYLAAHPELAQMGAAALVQNALVLAFPCESGRG